jgi:hypothetical protein
MFASRPEERMAWPTALNRLAAAVKSSVPDSKALSLGGTIAPQCSAGGARIKIFTNAVSIL